jgi:hypothetical protein
MSPVMEDRKPRGAKHKDNKDKRKRAQTRSALLKLHWSSRAFKHARMTHNILQLLRSLNERKLRLLVQRLVCQSICYCIFFS